jgi:peptidylprolyl isomerase
MTVGESKTVKIPAEQAYGHRKDDLVIKIPKEQFPPDISPYEGLVLNLNHPDGRVVNAMITDVLEDSVTLDANPPLAGEELTFDIELIEIV